MPNLSPSPTNLMSDASGTNSHRAVTTYRALPEHKVVGWSDATDKQRKTATTRAVIVRWMLLQTSITDAIDVMHNSIGFCGPQVITALNALGKIPSKATLYAWVKAYREKETDGLLPATRVRQKEQPWHARCLALYHAPNKPSFAQVADQLVTEKQLTHSAAKAHHRKVARFISTLPAQLQDKSQWRMGVKLYRESQLEYKLRDTTQLDPGDLYNADGHTLDVYLAHPKTGNAWRAELTVFQDVASRYIVGWELSEAESSWSTMAAFTRAMALHDHVPAIVYCDNGSGYKSKLMSDESTGVFARFGVSTLFAIPGNARAKWIERFFLHMEDRVARRFTTYCGRSHTERHKQQMLKEVKQGKRALPTVAQWTAEFLAFLDHYHDSAHPERPKQTRAEVWAQLKNVTPGVNDYRVLPRATVNVRRGSIVLDKRLYRAQGLHQYNGTSLIAGYDSQEDKDITLYDNDGAFLMFATLAERSAGVTKSRIEDAKIKRGVMQQKRLANHAAEAEARIAADRTIEASSDTIKKVGLDAPALTEIDAEIVDFELTTLQEMITPLEITNEPDTDDLEITNEPDTDDWEL